MGRGYPHIKGVWRQSPCYPPLLTPFPAFAHYGQSTPFFQKHPTLTVNFPPHPPPLNQYLCTTFYPLRPGGSLKVKTLKVLCDCYNSLKLGRYAVGTLVTTNAICGWKPTPERLRDEVIDSLG